MIRSVSNLEPGMIVDSDVETRGTVLLKANTVLTESHIQRLKRWNIPTINTTVAETTQQQHTSKEAMQEKLEVLQQEYTNRQNMVNSLFSPFKENNEMTTLRDCILSMFKDKYGN